MVVSSGLQNFGSLDVLSQWLNSLYTMHGVFIVGGNRQLQVVFRKYNETKPKYFSIFETYHIIVYLFCSVKVTLLQQNLCHLYSCLRTRK